MMTIIGVDPGTEMSAYVVFESANQAEPIKSYGYVSNDELLLALREKTIVPKDGTPYVFVFEFFESMGQRVGVESIETICWTGRMLEACKNWHRLKRTDVKLHLCGSRRAKDPDIRRVLLDRFGGDASGRAGGPLAKIKKHLWSALAVAVTYADLHCPMAHIKGDGDDEL